MRSKKMLLTTPCKHGGGWIFLCLPRRANTVETWWRMDILMLSRRANTVETWIFLCFHAVQAPLRPVWWRIDILMLTTPCKHCGDLVEDGYSYASTPCKHCCDLVGDGCGEGSLGYEGGSLCQPDYGKGLELGIVFL